MVEVADMAQADQLEDMEIQVALLVAMTASMGASRKTDSEAQDVARVDWTTSNLNASTGARRHSHLFARTSTSPHQVSPLVHALKSMLTIRNMKSQFEDMMHPQQSLTSTRLASQATSPLK